MAQPKKQKESLEDVVHDGADQAKDKKKRAALFGNSKKKEKLADSQSHLAEEKLKEEEAYMYTLLSAKLSEKAALDVELESVKDELRKEKEEKERLLACNEELRAEQQEMSSHLSVVESELQRSQEEDAILTVLTAKLKERVSLKAQLEAARDELVREQSDNVEQLAQLGDRLKAGQEEIEILKQRVSEMEVELRKKDDEKSALEEVLKREQGEKAFLMAQLSVKEGELKASEEERAVLYSELRKVQQEKALLQQRF